MNQVKNAIRSHRPIVIAAHNQRLSFVLSSGSGRLFSTTTEEANFQNPNPFPQPAHNQGFFYGRLHGITKRTTKTDILTLLDGSNVSMDDIRVGHNRSFTPTNMMLQFPSPQAFETACRVINRRGCYYRLERSDRGQWDYFFPYDGKYILLQGIPKLAQIDDIERFLFSCAYDASTPLQIVSRKIEAESDPVRLVVVRFPSRAQATYAFLKTNREFCLNEQVSVRVLE